MDSGRIQAIVIAASSGNVIYERFYDSFSEQDKAELRASLAESAEQSLRSNPSGHEFISRWRECIAAYRREESIWYFALGYGEYDELSLTEVIRALAMALKDSLKKVPSEALLFENYGRLCLIVDELIFEGLVDKTEPAMIQRGIAMKLD